MQAVVFDVADLLGAAGRVNLNTQVGDLTSEDRTLIVTLTTSHHLHGCCILRNIRSAVLIERLKDTALGHLAPDQAKFKYGVDLGHFVDGTLPEDCPDVVRVALGDVTLRSEAAEYAKVTRTLSLFFPVAFALGEEILTGQVPKWRALLSDHTRSRRTSVNAYAPGALRVSDDGVGEHSIAGHSFQLCCPHQDGGIATFVAQDNVGGLQIRAVNSRSRSWIDVPCVQDTVLVNTGRHLAEISNQFFPAVCHRVIRRSETETRISLATFVGIKHGLGTKGC
jgi:hypothetical protein